MSWKSSISICFCCLIFMFTIIGLPILIYYVVLQPKNPTFNLEHASVTVFNLTSNNHLTSFFNVVIKAENPNHKLKLKYSNLRISIHKSGQKLATDALDKFTQRTRNVTMLRSEAVALNVKLKKAPAFDIRFESGIGYLDIDVHLTGVYDMHFRRYNLEVYCIAVVNITSPVSNLYEDHFPSKGCRVKIYTNHV